MSRAKKAFLLTLPFIGCIVWYLLKVLQFQTSAEQYADGMVILQLSKGWLEGRPFLYDTVYGHHTRQHNYYFIPILGLVTKPFGVYGLFLAYLALVGVFFWKWYKNLVYFGTFVRTTAWLAAVFFIFGPMGYFIYLDYFGWHPEHYLIPLLALLAVSLAERNRAMIAVWLLLIFSVKESSIVLICCLLLFCSVVDKVLSNPGDRWFDYIFTRRNLTIVFISAVLFLGGLWWLSYLNGNQPSRLGLALSRVEFGPTLYLYITSTLIIGLLTFGLALIPFVPWLRAMPKMGLIISVLGGCYAVLLIMFATEALFYFPVIYPGVSYPARIGGLWAFTFSAFVFVSFRVANSGNKPGITAISWILTGGLLQFLLGPFLVAHFFDFKSRPNSQVANVSYLLKTHFGLHPYPEGIRKTLYDMAKQMPEGSEVIVTYDYIRLFENVYPGYWEEDGRAPAHMLGKPLLYVFEKELVAKGVYGDLPAKGYTIVPNEHVLILADSSWYNLKFR